MAVGLTGLRGFISNALAIVVIGGLLSSTVLTLIVLPTLYNLVEGAKERRRARKAGSGDDGSAPTKDCEPSDGPVPAARWCLQRRCRSGLGMAAREPADAARASRARRVAASAVHDSARLSSMPARKRFRAGIGAFLAEL